MTSTIKFMWWALLVVVGFGVLFLSVWGIPAPSAEIRKEVKLNRPLK